MTDRATHWSITINNPTPADTLCAVQGWRLTGQYEVGEEGTRHYQGMLTTPQVRFAAVKKQFPRAHIEIARDRQALLRYVHKEDTRLALVDTQLNVFSAQQVIADDWDKDEWNEMYKTNWESRSPMDSGELALKYVDILVAKRIQNGVRCLEFIGINPMWRSSWKKFWCSIIKRNAAQVQVQASQDAQESPSPGLVQCPETVTPIQEL